MIATISPTRSNADETVSTLHYASRTTQVVNRPKENAKVSKDTLLGALVAENEGLRRHLIVRSFLTPESCFKQDGRLTSSLTLSPFRPPPLF